MKSRQRAYARLLPPASSPTLRIACITYSSSWSLSGRGGKEHGHDRRGGRGGVPILLRWSLVVLRCCRTALATTVLARSNDRRRRTSYEHRRNDNSPSLSTPPPLPPTHGPAEHHQEDIQTFSTTTRTAAVFESLSLGTRRAPSAVLYIHKLPFVPAGQSTLTPTHPPRNPALSQLRTRGRSSTRKEGARERREKRRDVRRRSSPPIAALNASSPGCRSGDPSSESERLLVWNPCSFFFLRCAFLFLSRRGWKTRRIQRTTQPTRFVLPFAVDVRHCRSFSRVVPPRVDYVVAVCGL